MQVGDAKGGGIDKHVPVISRKITIPRDCGRNYTPTQTRALSGLDAERNAFVLRYSSLITAFLRLMRSYFVPPLPTLAFSGVNNNTYS
jgi:hypothetical protein